LEIKAVLTKNCEMKLFCIHGNLQTPSVWEPFEGEFQVRGRAFSLECENLYDEWNNEFCDKVENECSDEKPFLLGYSLGGRLALHACLARSDLWSGVIIVSADPGLSSSGEKRLQLQKDQQWAERFRSERLEDLLEEWDILPVFCGIPNSASRNLSEFNPEKISGLFDVFSKGHQRDLLPELRKLKTPPLLFISGQRDEKYTQIGKGLSKACPLVEHKIIPEAGHRVPWEKPELFVEMVREFMGLVLRNSP
jgi:2-succinyl-6-hydroxy-2,4-cyclohexadiene-1-carboxylate synthase